MERLRNLFGPNIGKLLEEKQYDEIEKCALKDKRVAYKLIHQLESKDPRMVERAAYLLGEMDEPRALPALDRVAGVESADDRHVSTLLGRMGLPLPTSFPQYPVVRSTDVGAVTAARQALAKIMYGDEEPLIASLKDRNAEVREKVAEALGMGGHSSKCAIEALITVSNQDENSRVRRKARLVLVNIGEPAVDFLIVALNDKNPRYRLQTAWALYWLWDRHKVERATEPFLAALNEKDVAVVAGAYIFFILRGDTGTEPILIKALEEYGQPEMVEHLINCGNSQLEEAGRRWSYVHGYQIKSSPFGGGPKWGRRR